MSPLQLEVLKHVFLIFFAGLFAGVSGGIAFCALTEIAGKKRVLLALILLAFGHIDGMAVYLSLVIL